MKYAVVVLSTDVKEVARDLSLMAVLRLNKTLTFYFYRYYYFFTIFLQNTSEIDPCIKSTTKNIASIITPVSFVGE